MSLAAPLLRRRNDEMAHRHPNEMDLHRIVRAISARRRYRYVSPVVLPVEHGYLVRSACCSRTVDAAGGEIDIALLRWSEGAGRWLLLAMDRATGYWVEDSRYARLADLFPRLNADPERRFWS